MSCDNFPDYEIKNRGVLVVSTFPTEILENYFERMIKTAIEQEEQGNLDQDYVVRGKHNRIPILITSEEIRDIPQDKLITCVNDEYQENFRIYWDAWGQKEEVLALILDLKWVIKLLDKPIETLEGQTEKIATLKEKIENAIFKAQEIKSKYEQSIEPISPQNQDLKEAVQEYLIDVQKSYINGLKIFDEISAKYFSSVAQAIDNVIARESSLPVQLLITTREILGDFLFPKPPNPQEN